MKFQKNLIDVNLMTEEELDALVEEVREDIYFEQHGQRSKQP